MTHPVLLHTIAVSLGVALAQPAGFQIKTFADYPQISYPTAVTASGSGDLYVSSDPNGSLGHAPGMGKIIRATDTDGDGKADRFVDFVPMVTSPRGGHFTGGTLYLIHPPYLSSYRDTNGDGVADETKQLVKGFGWGIEHPRGADHTTNGVRMGIDGWLYVAVGDFGMPDAVAADGTHLTLHGGGVVRIRPDGSEMELYASQVRNICDFAISPYLDLFSRDNTNDGKGWNTRLHHFVQYGNHGYPRLYQNFRDEALEPLADYGGGSGTGGLYLHEPGFPGDFGDSVFTCDWTTGAIYRHPMKPFEATFAAQQEDFLKLPRAIDIDVDGNSRLYIADWRNGGFAYAGDGKPVGLIQIMTCPGEKPAKFPDLAAANDTTLSSYLLSRSGVCRHETQREILARGAKPGLTEQVLKIASSNSAPLYSRVAAIFTYKQLLGAKANPALLKLLADAPVREFALRALTDRKTQLAGLSSQPFIEALKDKNPRVRRQALISLARLGDAGAAPAILQASSKWKGDYPQLAAGEHLVLPHLAVKALVELQAVSACLKGISEPSQRDIAARALQELHLPAAVDGLIALSSSTKDNATRLASLTALCRLYHEEKKWDLNSWWNTRPDDKGPYFEPVTWEATPRIKSALEKGFAELSDKNAFLDIMAKNRIPVAELKLSGIDPLFAALEAKEPTDADLTYLNGAAKDAKRPLEQRLQAYRALSNNKDATKTTPLRLDVLATWQEQKQSATEIAQMVNDFINDPSHGNHINELHTLAQKSNDTASGIAWRTLLTIANSPLAKPDAKKNIQEFTAKNPREVGFFIALSEMKLPGYDQQIDNAINSDNEHLIGFAKAAKAATQAKSASGKKVGEMPVEEVTAAALKGKGSAEIGQKLFTAQGCIACHAIDLKAEQKGPYLGAAGAKFRRDYLIESVLKPNAVVAQGFQTAMFQLKDGTTKMGFITNEADGVVHLRDIAGQSSQFNRSDVKEEQHLTQSMMPDGLANGLTIDEFIHLIEYLMSLKSVGG